MTRGAKSATPRLYKRRMGGYNQRNTSGERGGEGMLELAGRSIAEQIAIGQLHFYRREPPVLAPRSQRGPQEELERFQQGQRQAVLQLAALYDRAFAEVGEETASIFAIHAMLLEDEDLVRTITDMIQREGATAEYAVKAAGMLWPPPLERWTAPICGPDRWICGTSPAECSGRCWVAGQRHP